MHRNAASFALVLALSVFPAAAQIATPEMNRVLTDAARTLSAMPFDSNAPVTVHGRVGTLVWPEKASGMIVIEGIENGQKYAFSTAGVPAMARQGFTRFAWQPGAEVIVTGVLAAGQAKIGPGFNAARADLITKSGDGTRVFDRSRLP